MSDLWMDEVIYVYIYIYTRMCACVWSSLVWSGLVLVLGIIV